MTTNATVKPFLTRFSEPLGNSRETALRYDEGRQISQVLVDGAWIDAAQARIPAVQETRMTKVHQETTDDV